MPRSNTQSALFDGTPLSRANVYDRLRDLVVRGELAPSTRLTEPMVAERLGISRTPARQAMHRLQLEGLLVPDGGGERPRVAVAPLDANEAMEVYRTTGMLESASARAVASFPAGQRQRLADSMAAFDEAFRKEAAKARPDPTRLFANHHGFHQALVHACASAVTRMLLTTLFPRRARYEWFHGPLARTAGQSFTDTYREHDAIVDAVAGGTATQVERAVRHNWDEAAERLAAAIRYDAARRE
jgi:DNA-binding GntR family transcriptional regulator